MRTAPALVIVDAAVTEALDPVLLLSAYREALAGIGITDVADGRIIAGFGRSPSCFFDELIDDRQLAWLARRSAVRLFTARVLRHLAERRHPSATTAGDALARLRAAGLRVVLVSDLPTPALDGLVLRHGWRKLLDATLSIDDVAQERPAPDLVRAAMALLGHDRPAEVVNVAAHHAHVAAARTAGVGRNVVVGWTPGKQDGCADIMTPTLSAAVDWLVADARRPATAPPSQLMRGTAPFH